VWTFDEVTKLPGSCREGAVAIHGSLGRGRVQVLLYTKHGGHGAAKCKLTDVTSRQKPPKRALRLSLSFMDKNALQKEIVCPLLFRKSRGRKEAWSGWWVHAVTLLGSMPNQMTPNNPCARE
jgi:hypothetical protein